MPEEVSGFDNSESLMLDSGFRGHGPTSGRLGEPVGTDAEADKKNKTEKKKQRRKKRIDCRRKLLTDRRGTI